MARGRSEIVVCRSQKHIQYFSILIMIALMFQRIDLLLSTPKNCGIALLLI